MRHMHRFSVDEIRSSYAGLEAAFLAGDYLLTAEFAPAGSELAGCSLALCGLLEAGEAALAALAAPGAMARLCLAFVQWSLGRPAEAKRELEALLRAEPDHALARDLLALVMAPTIPTWCVSVALPIQTSASKDSRAGEYRYNQFLVRNVGTQLSANALDYQCSQSFAAEIAATPAADRPFFVFSGTPQWFIPRDLKAAGIPTILWCHDTELFYHRMSDNYNIFDISVVCTSQEHFEVSRASGSVAASNFFGDMLVLPFFGAAPDLNKEWDLIFTGTTLDSEQTDRVTFLWQLSALSERFKVLIVDGHLHEIEYLKLLGRGKFSPVISRYRGCPSPRWRDALSRGTFVLYPAETTYRHFSPGCFPFRPEHLAEDITPASGSLEHRYSRFALQSAGTTPRDRPIPEIPGTAPGPAFRPDPEILVHAGAVEKTRPAARRGRQTRASRVPAAGPGRSAALGLADAGAGCRPVPAARRGGKGRSGGQMAGLGGGTGR